MTTFFVIYIVLAVMTICIMTKVFTGEDKLPMVVIIVGWPLFFCILLYTIIEHLWTCNCNEDVHVRFKE